MDAAYEAAQLASRRRDKLLKESKSFVTETVASHPSKLKLIQDAKTRGYEVWVSFLYLESADLSVRRVARRVRQGGHPVPEEKIRARFARMAPIAVEAIQMADRGFLIDNSGGQNPLRTVMLTERGRETWRHKRPPQWLESLFPRTER
jgi:predicted ABC-type ATPase